jgi:hypothetical protein
LALEYYMPPSSMSTDGRSSAATASSCGVEENLEQSRFFCLEGHSALKLIYH